MADKWLEISKNTHFFEVHFSLSKKHISCKPSLTHHAVWIVPLGVSNDYSDFDVFRPRKRKAQTKKEA